MGTCGVVKEKGVGRVRGAHKEKCEKIANYSFERADFSPLKEFQDIYTELLGNFIVPRQMAIIVLEFKRFMMLKVLCRDLVTPSPIVDRFWRLLLGHTVMYEEFCEEVFGRLIHRNSLDMFQAKTYF